MKTCEMLALCEKSRSKYMFDEGSKKEELIYTAIEKSRVDRIRTILEERNQNIHTNS